MTHATFCKGFQLSFSNQEASDCMMQSTKINRNQHHSGSNLGFEGWYILDCSRRTAWLYLAAHLGISPGEGGDRCGAQAGAGLWPCPSSCRSCSRDLCSARGPCLKHWSAPHTRLMRPAPHLSSLLSAVSPITPCQPQQVLVISDDSSPRRQLLMSERQLTRSQIQQSVVIILMGTE